jgi:hypothetical protein
MQRKKFLVGLVGGATAVVALGAVGTHAIAGTQSTTGLDTYSTVTVDGHKALSGTIVAAPTESRYHPLPWVGTKVTDVACPNGLSRPEPRRDRRLGLAARLRPATPVTCERSARAERVRPAPAEGEAGSGRG